MPCNFCVLDGNIQFGVRCKILICYYCMGLISVFRQDIRDFG